MARAYSPNNTEANAVRTRKANDRKAAELRAAGYTVTYPCDNCEGVDRASCPICSPTTTTPKAK